MAGIIQEQPAPTFQIQLKSISERDYGSEDGQDTPFMLNKDGSLPYHQ